MNKESTVLDSKSTSPASIPDSHPPAIWFFFWGEFAERSSYYGMRAILFLYMTQALRLSVIEASPIYAAFKMGCYLLPLLGGLLADRWIGRYWTIVGFSVPYVLGHFILGFSDPTILGDAIGSLSPERLAFIARMLLFISLALLAGGSGVIKPNISSLLGQTYDQKRPGKERLRSSAFLWFYLAINVGALISQLALPAIREWYIMSHLDAETLQQAQQLVAEGKGEDVSKLASAEVLGRAYQLAFAFPTILMALSLGVFAAGKRTYATDNYGRENLTPEERRQRWESLLFVLGIYGLFVLYFVFDQFGLPRIPSEARQGAKAGAIGLTFAAAGWLIVRSVFTAGKRTFATEQQEGRHLTVEQQRQHLKTLGYLLGIFGLVVFFWFGYEHNDVLWIGFTRDYVNLNVPLVRPLVHFISGKDTIAPDQLQFLNALFVIILVPTFNGIFKYLDPDLKIFTAMRKILAGFILTAAAVGIMAAAGYLAQGHTTTIMIKGEVTEVCEEQYKVSFLWPAMAYIVLTFGEVLLYGTMLDLSYAAAPQTMKGYITACFLLTNTAANFLNILWMPYYGGSLADPPDKRGLLLPGPFFAITAAFTVAATLAFLVIGKQFEKSYQAQKQAGMAS
jgi:dipeptide/tripeptide permease